MKKFSLTKFLVIALPIIIVCVIIGAFIRLLLWDKGYFSKEPDWSSIETDISAEACDYYSIPSREKLDANNDGVTKVVILGDDTYAAYRGDTGVAAYLAQYTGATVYNCTFEGARAASVYPAFNEEYGDDIYSFYRIAVSAASENFIFQRSYERNASLFQDYYYDNVSLLQDIDFDTVDVIIVNYGQNDFIEGFPLDNEDNPYDIGTYAGALRYGLDLLKNRYPNANIIVCSPYYCDLTDENGNFVAGDTTRNKADALLSHYMRKALYAATERDITFLDNYFGMDYIRTESNVYLDETHQNLSEEGRKKMAERLAYTIIYKFGYEYEGKTSIFD